MFLGGDSFSVIWCESVANDRDYFDLDTTEIVTVPTKRDVLCLNCLRHIIENV